MDVVNYKVFMEGGGFVNSDKSGYYEYWVKRFLSLNLSDSLGDSDKLNQFLSVLGADEISKTGKSTRRALRLKFTFFVF